MLGDVLLSRGLGVLQRQICEALDGAEGGELALRELRRRLGEPDRSNVRRAIRGLLERKIVVELREGNERRVGLVSWASAPKESPSKPSRPLSRRQTPGRDSRRVL